MTSQPSSQPQRSVFLAGFWRRFFAYIIDSIVLGFLNALLFGIFGGFLWLAIGGSPEEIMKVAGGLAASPVLGAIRLLFAALMALLVLVTPLWTGWLYFALLESSLNSATLGKMALGIVVSDKQGRRITFERATARYFAKIITNLTFGVGWLMAAFTSRKQALHDIIAGCFVLYRAPSDYYQQMPPAHNPQQYPAQGHAPLPPQ